MVDEKLPEVWMGERLENILNDLNVKAQNYIDNIINRSIDKEFDGEGAHNKFRRKALSSYLYMHYPGQVEALANAYYYQRARYKELPNRVWYLWIDKVNAKYKTNQWRFPPREEIDND